MPIMVKDTLSARAVFDLIKAHKDKCTLNHQYSAVEELKSLEDDLLGNEIIIKEKQNV